MSYKKQYGYQPGVCTINEAHILYIENRNGNSDAKSFQIDTLKRFFDLLDAKKVKKINNLEQTEQAAQTKGLFIQRLSHAAMVRR